jgi:exosortase A-associated hydrolase 2
MSLAAQAAPFFLDAGGGERFCLYHPPVGGCRGAFVYVHPFGDEMNRTRRMAALGARALARAGYGVLQIDLAGCGDSSGEFGEARWQTWKDDLALARGWLAGRLGRTAGVWGLRLGALLALDHAADLAASGDEPPHLLLWQPVLAGATYLTQVLRLRMAGDLVGANAGTGGHGADSPQALRALLGGGSAVEIGGYLLAPELAAALDRLDAVHLAPAGAPRRAGRLVRGGGRARASGAAGGPARGGGLAQRRRWQRQGRAPAHGRRPKLLGEPGNHRMPGPDRGHRGGAGGDGPCLRHNPPSRPWPSTAAATPCTASCTCPRLPPPLAGAAW